MRSHKSVTPRPAQHVDAFDASESSTPLVLTLGEQFEFNENSPARPCQEENSERPTQSSPKSSQLPHALSDSNDNPLATTVPPMSAHRTTAHSSSESSATLGFPKNRSKPKIQVSRAHSAVGSQASPVLGELNTNPHIATVPSISDGVDRGTLAPASNGEQNRPSSPPKSAENSPTINPITQFSRDTAVVLGYHEELEKTSIEGEALSPEHTVTSRSGSEAAPLIVEATTQVPGAKRKHEASTDIPADQQNSKKRMKQARVLGVVDLLSDFLNSVRSGEKRTARSIDVNHEKKEKTNPKRTRNFPSDHDASGAADASSASTKVGATSSDVSLSTLQNEGRKKRARLSSNLEHAEARQGHSQVISQERSSVSDRSTSSTSISNKTKSGSSPSKRRAKSARKLPKKLTGQSPIPKRKRANKSLPSNPNDRPKKTPRNNKHSLKKSKPKKSALNAQKVGDNSDLSPRLAAHKSFHRLPLPGQKSRRAPLSAESSFKTNFQANSTSQTVSLQAGLLLKSTKSAAAKLPSALEANSRTPGPTRLSSCGKHSSSPSPVVVPSSLVPSSSSSAQSANSTLPQVCR